MHGEIVEMGKVSIYVKFLQSLMMRLLRKTLWFLLYQILSTLANDDTQNGTPNLQRSAALDNIPDCKASTPSGSYNSYSPGSGSYNTTASGSGSANAYAAASGLSNGSDSQ